MTYHAVAQSVDTEMKIIPVGSVFNLMTLNSIEEQIRNSIFGVEIYMIRDRDGLSDSQITGIEKSGRIRFLRRRHIENYFLDEEILLKVAEQLYLTKTNPSLNSATIKDETKRIAEESINYNIFKNFKEYLGQNHHFNPPKVQEVEAKTTAEVKQELIRAVAENLNKLSVELEERTISAWLDSEEEKLRKMLETDEWKLSFQGKLIFSKVCSGVLKGHALRIKQAYVDIALSQKPEVLNDLIDIFKEMK